MAYDNFVAIEGSEQFHKAKSRILRPTDKNELITVTIALRENPAGDSIQQTVAKQGNVAPVDRSFLTETNRAAVHGATQSDIDEVTAYVQSKGLVAGKTDQANRTMTVTGRAADLEAAFKVRMADVADPNGNIYRGQVGIVQIPSELQGKITHVMDFSNRPKARPHFVLPQQAQAQQQIIYPSGLFAKAMNVPLVTQDGANGTVKAANVVVGLFELGGTDAASDQQAYCAKYGYANSTVVHISVNGNVPTPDPTGANVEVALDEDVAMGMAPGGYVLVYDAANTTAGVLAMINLAIQHATKGYTIPGTNTTVFPMSFSMSWGGAELVDWSAADMQTINTALANLCAVGGTAGFSAGDAGSVDGGTAGTANADFPGSSPYGFCWGGLSADINTTTGQTNAACEWGGSAAEMNVNGGGGGGASVVFGIPAFQSANGIKPITASTASSPNQPGRGLPDASGVADPMTGTAVCAGGTFQGVGGTSSSSPQGQTGIAILVAANGGKGFGQIQNEYYALKGKGSLLVENGTNGAYNAADNLGDGYNLCTGWGMPNFTEIGTSFGLVLGAGSMVGTNPAVATPMAQNTAPATLLTPPTGPKPSTPTPPAVPNPPSAGELE